MTALINVMRAELFKSAKKKRTYIMATLLWVILPVIALIVGKIAYVTLNTNFAGKNGVDAQTVVQAFASPFGIARLSLVLPSVISPSFYIIVLALLAALFIGEERNQNMWKTTLVAQPNRFSVLLGKFLVAMILFGILMLGSYLLSFVYGGIGTLFLPTDFSGDWLYLAKLYLLQWLFGTAGMSFAFLMIWWFRNISLGIISIFFLPALLEGIYTVYATVVGFKPVNQLNIFFQGLKLRTTLENLPKYFFSKNFYAPARDPLSNVITELGGNLNNNSDLGPLANIIGANITLTHSAKVMAVYALIFGLIMLWSFRRRDVS